MTFSLSLSSGNNGVPLSERRKLKHANVIDAAMTIVTKRHCHSFLYFLKSTSLLTFITVHLYGGIPLQWSSSLMVCPVKAKKPLLDITQKNFPETFVMKREKQIFQPVIILYINFKMVGARNVGFLFIVF